MRSRGHRAGLLLATSALAWASAAAGGETVGYTYDALGRLKVTTSNGAAGSTAIEYDAAGNRKTYAVTGASTDPRVSGGSFEVSEVNSNYVWAPFSPAAFTGFSGIAGNGSAFGFAPAPDGDQVGFVESEGPASITLAVTNLAPGTAYTANFYIAARPDYSGAHTVTVAFNGTPIGTFTPGSTSFALATTQPFVPSSNAGSLTFSSVPAPGYRATAIDKVRVQ